VGSTTGALARFLLPGDDVEHGGDDGGHGGAWGFPNRRRWPESWRLGFRQEGKIKQEEEELGPEIVSRLLYGIGARLVTKLSPGRSPARRRSRARLCAILHARRRDEDDFVLRYFSDEGVRAGFWAVCWAVLWAAGGPCWWAVAAKEGPSEIFSSLFFFPFPFCISIFYIVNLSTILNSNIL
jgi:hypothetical protein